MLEAIIYIGIAQSLFTSVILLVKKPLRIADVILSVWMIEIVFQFVINYFLSLVKLEEEFWVLSVVISISYPPTLYLYSKYVTVRFRFFKQIDLLHFLPFLFSILILLFFKNSEVPSFFEGLLYINNINWVKYLLGNIFIIMLWIYGFLAIVKVIKYKKQIPDNYSYISNRISLTWLLVLIISFLVLYHVNILISSLVNRHIIQIGDDVFRNITLLVYVYIVSVWGYQQVQLLSDPKKVKLNIDFRSNNISESGKYQKSKINKNQADDYVKQLIDYMNKTQAWKDSELSISKISKQTNIPKHHITQVLNEYLQKNFYNFVNEYRIEHAKMLIKSPKYSSWSFVAIAYECGFNSKSSFYSFFKKNTGITPSEYKVIEDAKSN